MLLDVRPILHTPGKRLDFQFELDLSDVEFAGRYPVSRPVAVEGEIRNSADVLSLDMTLQSTLDAVCDRCGKEFLLDKELAYMGGAFFTKEGRVSDISQLKREIYQKIHPYVYSGVARKVDNILGVLKLECARNLQPGAGAIINRPPILYLFCIRRN